MLDSTRPNTKGTIVCYWSRTRETRNNFGDALNPVILAALTGKSVSHYNDASQWRKLTSPMLFCIGSILERNKISHRNRPGKIHVWGTGTRGENSLAHLKNATIHAVRGPLTGQKLLADGVPCPEIYGDPATLLPQIFKRVKSTSPEICVMPHYVDVLQCHSWLKKNNLAEKVRVLDVMAPIEQLANDISAAKVLVSSSLHGLIVADAYGVPNARIRFGDAISGGDFKFHDYFLSVERTLTPPIDGGVAASTESLEDYCVLGNTTLIEDIDRALPSFCRR